MVGEMPLMWRFRAFVRHRILGRHEMHRHTCLACGHQWRHCFMCCGRSVMERTLAHTCPSCGRERWFHDGDLPIEVTR